MGELGWGCRRHVFPPNTPSLRSCGGVFGTGASSFQTDETPGDSLSSSIKPDAASFGATAASFEADETPGDGTASSIRLDAIGSVAPKDEAVLSRDVAGVSKDVAV